MLARQFRQHLLSQGWVRIQTIVKSEGRHRGQTEGEMYFTLAPDRTIIRLGRLPSWEAGRRANNYSGARNAAHRSARQNEQ